MIKSPTPLTSDTDPLRVDRFPLDLPGTLGVTFAPGKRGPSLYRSNTWERDLAKDLDRLRDPYRTSLLVSLVEDHELVKLHIPDLVAEAEARGMRVRRFPIVDMSVPPSYEAIGPLLEEMLDALRKGENVVVHCAGGLGRSGVIAGCALVAAGQSSWEALAVLRGFRAPNCPETDEQEDFIHGFEKTLGKTDEHA